MFATLQGDHELDPGLNAELLVDCVQMTFDRAFGHAQFLGDFPIGKSVTEQSYDLLLAIT